MKIGSSLWASNQRGLLVKLSLRAKLGTAAVALSLAALTACGADTPEQKSTDTATESQEAQTVSISHAQGTTEVPVSPETVYVFDLGVLDSMTALGVDADGVPDAVFPDSLAKYEDASFAKIGSMKEPDFETIAAGEPDLIIISGRTAGAFEELNKIAPTVDLSVDAAEPLTSFEEQATSLGKIFDREDEVAAKLGEIEEQIAATNVKGKEAGSGLIVLTSAGEVTAYGPGSRFGLIHDELGVPAAAEVKHDGAHGEAISFEFIKEANPDYLFVVDRDAAMGTAGDAAAAVLNNELVASTNAAKNDQIVYLDASGWYMVGYGLNNLPAMITSIDSAL